ncbi:hypothetical protein A2U01_0077902, partial [Trifolium medium]|nr:hypothetical protein [Trifolium medium]
ELSISCGARVRVYRSTWKGAARWSIRAGSLTRRSEQGCLLVVPSRSVRS